MYVLSRRVLPITALTINNNVTKKPKISSVKFNFSLLLSSCFAHHNLRSYSTTVQEAVTTTELSSILSEPRVLPLLAKIKSDIKDAMRSKDKGKLNVVKGLLSDITYASKSANSTNTIPSTDADICTIIQRAIKRRQESIDQYSAANRTDLASAEQTELEILQTYLPPQLSDQEIEDEVKKVLSSVGASSVKDLGRVMKEVKLDPSRAPKKRISEVVKRLLS